MAGTRSTADLTVLKLLAKKLFTLKRGAAACRWIRLLLQFMIWFVSIKTLLLFQTINLFVKSLLSTDTSAHLKSAWIGAERTKTGAWKWMDGSNFVFSNFVTDNSDDGNAIIGVDGRWESQV